MNPAQLAGTSRAEALFVFAARLFQAEYRLAQGSILNQIWEAIVAFFQSIWAGIVSFFGAIAQSIANVIVAIFQSPINAINASWVAFQAWANQYGPLAPIFTILVFGAFLLIAVFFIWLAVKLTTSEAEGVGTEVEEGV